MPIPHPPEPPPFREVHPAEAELLVAQGKVHVLDVRSPGEYQQAGHIPGALLLPVDLIAAGPATLPRDGKPILVTCEHGIRSVHAATLLGRAGVAPVLNLAGGMSCWNGPREHGPVAPAALPGPAAWLLENSDLLPWGGKALDVACGWGRHALLLAAAGFHVTAMDRDAGRIAFLRTTARNLDLPVVAMEADLETGAVDLGEAAHDLVLVVNYLHRPLFPALIRALKPGGLLLYETFSVDQAAREEGPDNPEFLLQHDELARLAASLDMVRQREGEHDGRAVASVAALKPAGRESAAG
ncbi:MAG: rhodanese-like domain-containing protein [Acidobacteriota bacterium]